MIAKHTVRSHTLAGALALMLGLAAVASAQAPVISGSLPSTTDVGATYLSAPVQLVTGGIPPYTWTLSTTLTWLNFNTDGTASVSGTPTTAGMFSIMASVTDSSPTPLTSPPVTFNIKVNLAVQITPASLPAGQQGAPYPVTTLVATGGTGSNTWSLASGSPPLPPGLTLGVTTGSIGPGPPTAFGVFPFTAQVTDGLTTATQGFSITIAPPPLVVLTTTLPPGEASAPYTAGPSATGGVPPYTWSITGLPAGLTFSTNTGVISGPLAANATTSTAVVLQVTDSSPTTVSSPPLTLAVSPALSIATPSTLSGEATVPYSQTLTASGGSGAGLTWTLASGTLPTGLSLSGATISGTPTTPGPFNFTIALTDSLGGSAQKAFTLTITAGPSISTPSLPNGEVTAPYSQTLAVTDPSTPAPYTFAVTGGPPPPNGLTLNAAGAITGTPTATGTFNFTVQVTDSAGGKGTQNFTITVIAAPIINTNATLPGGEVGAAYSQTLSASGGSNAGYTWSLAGGSSLPAGLSLSPGGVLSGTPLAAALGTTSFTVQVTDSVNGTATLVMSITIIAGPTITTAPALPNGTVGVTYTTVTLSASGGTQPYIWSITVGSLPSGLSLNANAGIISGNPTASGPFNFTVQVKDAKNVTETKQFSITIAAGLTITTAPDLPNGNIGIVYSVTISAAGGTPPYTFSVISGSLPNGLTFNSSTGAIKGFPTSSGSFPFTVQVTDSASVTATKAFTLTVASSLVFTTPPTLPSAALGVPYSQALGAAGGTPPYTFVITAGALPNGLGLSSVSNLISGTPVSSGTFTFTIQVRDSNSVTLSQTFSLTVVAGLVITTPQQLPQGAVNSPYSQPLAAAGGTAPYTWTLQGTLPPGLSLSGGIIGGVPTANGTSTFTVRVTDNAGVSATKQFTLTIGAGLAITTSSALPPGTLGQAYTPFTLSAVGGSQPYAWSVSAGAVPAGFSVSSLGVITGTPSAAGAFTFTLQVKDITGATATQVFNISIVTPKVPPVNVPGEPASSPAGQQLSFGVSLTSPYPLDITGQIAASFQPDAVAPAVDPAFQFSTGGLTANYTIPANSTNAVFSSSSQKIGLQTGTISGTITLTFTMAAAGIALPSFQNTITISRAVPTIQSVKLVRTSGGLEIHVVAFSPSRDLTEADLTFTAAPGSTLQTTTLTENLASVATAWYQSTASAQYGSLLMLVLPITASQGSVDAVGSVAVVLKNAEGASPSATGTY